MRQVECGIPLVSSDFIRYVTYQRNLVVIGEALGSDHPRIHNKAHFVGLVTFFHQENRRIPQTLLPALFDDSCFFESFRL